MKKSKMILFALALLFAFAGNTKAQDGSEYLLWEKTPGVGIKGQGIAFNFDETKLAIAGIDTDGKKVLKLFETKTGNEIQTIILQNTPQQGIFYTNDGKYLIVRCAEANEIYDANTYKYVRSINSGGISNSPDGKLLALNKTGLSFQIINLDNFEIIAEKSYPSGTNGEQAELYVQYTSDGNYLIMNRSLHKLLPEVTVTYFNEVIDTKNYQKIDKEFNCLKGTQAFNFSADGTLLARGGNFTNKTGNKVNGFQIFDWEKDSLIWEQETAYFDLLNFLSGTNSLLSEYMDGIDDKQWDKTGNYRIWDLKNHLQKVKFPLFCNENVVISKSNKYLACTCGDLRIYNFEKILNVYVTVNEPIKSIEFNITKSPDNKILKITSNNKEITNIEIYDLSGNLVGRINKGFTKSISVEYNTSRLAKGVYLLKIDTDKESFTKKIIIE